MYARTRETTDASDVLVFTPQESVMVSVAGTRAGTEGQKGAQLLEVV